MLSLQLPLSRCHFHPNPRIQIRLSNAVESFSRCCATLDSDDQSGDSEISSAQRMNYAGVRLEETVDSGSVKSRLDSWISSRIPGISRARVQSCIRSGLVTVNGQIISKVSHSVKSGDSVDCTIAELHPLRAEPEDIPLDIKYEDDHVLVANKPPHMVVHPAPGNPTGTLVNAILHHCSLQSAMLTNTDFSAELEDATGNDDDVGILSTEQKPSEGITSNSSVRPGIVHRLDKGTSGLLVIAKNEQSHAHLSEQFKLHTVDRLYISITSGVPSPTSGRVEIPIGRDLNNRVRMTAVTGLNYSGHSRYAASRYEVVEVLANGGLALVVWRLETGRTHQIRVHAKYMGIPLLGDEVYGGTKDMALSLLRSRNLPSCHAQFIDLVSCIERPCLHAMVLGFKHPYTGKHMHFSCHPPTDFTEVLGQLRQISSRKLVSGSLSI